MLNFGASKPRVKGGPGPPGTPTWIRTWKLYTRLCQDNFFVCLKVGLVQLFLLDLFQIYRSSLLPHLYSSTCGFGLNVANCPGF